jgi:hypothetical protein
MNISFKAKIYLSLLTILAVGLVCSCANPTPSTLPLDDPSEQPNVSQVPNEPSNAPDRVDVVYFHQKNPCHCMAVVGDYIQETVFLNFGAESASGKLTFKMIVSDDKANADMVKKYNTNLFQLFITEVRGEIEKTYPVDEIWGLTGDPDKLKEFVKTTIEKSLKGET